MLRSRRNREQEFAELEAAGESLWTSELDDRAAIRLNELWSMIENQIARRTFGYQDVARHSASIASTMRVQGGWKVPERIGSGAFKAATGNDLELMLDLLEAVVQEYADVFSDIDDYVNTILREHRIGFRVVEHEVLDRGSDELHSSVVAPALQLLVSRRFGKAHDSYLDALKEITAGKPGDAITDAGTALQETLTALGCRGNALGPLLEDAQRKGLLASHDKKLADWVSADRSTTGDAHHHSGATEADAWLNVHVVGALIVRLADGDSARGSA
jgi:hypothetical protein